MWAPSQSSIRTAGSTRATGSGGMSHGDDLLAAFTRACLQRRRLHRRHVRHFMAVCHQAFTGSVIMGIRPETIGGGSGGFDREDGLVKNLFAGDPGSANRIPMNPLSDETYVPTWPTPQEQPPLPPKEKLCPNSISVDDPSHVW